MSLSLKGWTKLISKVLIKDENSNNEKKKIWRGERGGQEQRELRKEMKNLRARDKKKRSWFFYKTKN